MKNRKSYKLHILLSVAALFVIALTAFGITYSWIEGGTTYSIQTEEDGDVKTGSVPDTKIYEGLTLSPSINSEISLNQFDKNTNSAQEIYFSEVSSADGLNFFFPTAFDKSHNATSFRKANNNDYGTKFINYNFDVTVAKKCYLAFSESPIINVVKNGSKVNDTSAFRIMIKNGEKSYILTTASDSKTTQAVTDVKGTTQELTAYSANDYVYNDNHTAKLFEYETGDTDNIEVSVWLDGESATSEILGADVTVDMNLKAIEELYKIIFDAVTESNSGDSSVDDFTGGKINGGSVKIEKSILVGETASATATANTHYTFGGWYSDSKCDTADLVTDDVKISKTVDSNATYYAKFVEDPKFNVSFDAVTFDNNGNTTENGFIGGVIKESTTTHATPFNLKIYENDTVSATATANDNYNFDGWYSDKACTVSISSDNVLSKAVTGNATYYAKFVEKSKYTIDVKSKTYPDTETGGTVSINGESSYLGYKDSTATIKAEEKEGYGFVGWYTDEDCTNEYSTTADTTVTVGSENATYYAKFVKQYNVTLIVKTDGADGGNGGAVNIDSEVSDDSTEITVTKKVTHGSIVNLYAKENYGYQFTGIYDSEDKFIQKVLPCSQQITSDVTYYACFEKLPDSTTTIYFETREGFKSYYAWVYSDVGAHYSGSAWPGTAATLDSATGYYKYTFTTSDTGKFRVIVSDNGSNQYPAGGSDGLEGDIGGTYLFKSGSPSKLETFDPSSKITISVVAVTEGTVTVNGSSSVLVDAGSTVNLVATPNEGYTFAGWYTNSSCEDKYKVENASETASVTVGSTNTTYYAKFVETENKNIIYLKPNSNWKQASARFAIYLFVDDNTYQWVSMTQVGSTGYYQAEIPDGNWKNIIFVRMNGNTTDNNWNNKWNQTSDLTIPTDGTNCYAIASGTWDKGGGTWSTYTP